MTRKKQVCFVLFSSVQYLGQDKETERFSVAGPTDKTGFKYLTIMRND